MHLDALDFYCLVEVDDIYLVQTVLEILIGEQLVFCGSYIPKLDKISEKGAINCFCWVCHQYFPLGPKLSARHSHAASIQKQEDICFQASGTQLSRPSLCSGNNHQQVQNGFMGSETLFTLHWMLKCVDFAGD